MRLSPAVLGGVLLLFFIGLVLSLVFLPVTYSYDEVCPKCHGAKIVTCSTCGGSGVCWICSGDGKNDYLPPGEDWCAACSGIRRQHTKTTDRKQIRASVEIITPTHQNDDIVTALALALYAAKNQPRTTLLKA